MKLVNVSLVLSSLFAANFAYSQEDAAYELITNSCGSCHVEGSMSAAFVDENGAIIESNIELYAEKIIDRINRAADARGVMPPKSTPAFMKLDVTQKATLTSYLKTLAPTTTPTAPTPTAPVAVDDSIVPLSSLKVEPGFKVEVFAQARGARSLAVHSSGIVFVGTGGFSDVDPEGRVHAIVPTATGNKVVTFAKNLDNPNGVAIQGNDLYVAELNRIVVYKNAIASAKAIAAKTLLIAPKPALVKSDLRVQDEHNWKYIAIGPDNKLYVGIGADCNVCSEDREVGASIFRMDLDGSNFEQVAKGVRNTVGITFHPVTGEMWFTDNGRDSLGDTLPGDELNVLKSPVQDFGFPFCFASNVTDPQFGKNTDCNSTEFTKPVRDLGPHVAALGLTHYTGSTFPAKYKNATFVAEHGSWNSSKKVGYRLTIVEETVTGGKSTFSYRPFIEGFATTTTNWGRPSDVKNYIDGSLLLSDDHSGVVYKISPK